MVVSLCENQSLNARVQSELEFECACAAVAVFKFSSSAQVLSGEELLIAVSWREHRDVFLRHTVVKWRWALEELKANTESEYCKTKVEEWDPMDRAHQQRILLPRGICRSPCWEDVQIQGRHTTIVACDFHAAPGPGIGSERPSVGPYTFEELNKRGDWMKQWVVIQNFTALNTMFQKKDHTHKLHFAHCVEKKKIWMRGFGPTFVVVLSGSTHGRPSLFYAQQVPLFLCQRCQRRWYQWSWFGLLLVRHSVPRV